MSIRTTPDGMVVRDADPGAAAGVNLVTTTAVTPYATIAAALADAGVGDAVLVGPGTYAESITVPAGVTLKGVNGVVNLTGAAPTGTRVTLNDNSIFLGFTVTLPTDALPAVSFAVAGEATVRDVRLIGAGAAGIGIRNSGAGILTSTSVFYESGVCDAAFENSGTGLHAVRIASFVAGSMNAPIRSSGAGEIRAESTVVTAGGPTWTDGAVVAAGTLFLLSSDLDNGAATNGLHITADGVTITVVGGSIIRGSVWDILVDPALTGAGTTIDIAGSQLRTELFSAPAGYWDTALPVMTFSDLGVTNDRAFRVFTELVVGHPEYPTELAAGEGDSSTDFMHVFSNDGAATWVDNTAAAKSRSGSPFNIFQGVAAGNAAYFISETRAFNGIKVSVTAAQVIGAGAGVWEYLSATGPDVWTAVNVMATDADGSDPNQYAQVVFARIQNDQILFNWPQMRAGGATPWVTGTVNGQAGFPIRYRLTVGITTVPTVERVKLGTNRTEINPTGLITRFGAAGSTHLDGGHTHQRRHHILREHRT
jgi:hypothetical protein